MKYSSFADYLNYLFEKKKKINKSFSLRSFAKLLDVSPGRLSDILKGKSGINKITTLKMAEKLKLQDKEKEYFILLSEYSFAKDEKEKKQVQTKISKLKYTNLDSEISNLVTDWRALTLIELVIMNKIKFSEINKLALLLKTSNDELQNIVKILVQNEILQVNEQNLLQTTNVSLATSDEIPSTKIRTFHKNMLMKAVSAIDEQEINKRDVRGMIFSIQKENVKNIKQDCEDFLAYVLEKYAHKKNKDAVYDLHISLFDILNKEVNL